MPKKIKAIISNCSGCGDTMIYNPEINMLFCPSCKSSKKIKSNLGMPKHDVNSKDEKLLNKNQEWIKNIHEMECPNCGAHVMLNNYQVTTNCPYCDTSLIASKNNSSALHPDAIIPFKISRTQAENMFKKKLQEKSFAPKRFKQSIKADEIHAYYFPTFVFDANCSSVYNGKLYNTYTVKDKNGFSETKKRYFSINGSLNTNHQEIEIEASSKLSQYELSIIKPFNYKEAFEYTDEYVFGYELECNSSNVKETSSQARNVIDQHIRREILSKYSHDGVDSLTIQTAYNTFRYCYCVLPMYRINYTYKNKKYSNVMNGQTGALGGSYPKSVAKIVALILGILLIVGLPVLLIVLSAIGII